ncbi:ABC transporter ATP-binding protein [Pseudonocardia endophytica]|uniref:ABC-2 type transport system ATP-binding protein n=1 Tax=Pseudonocardia endophytica TaxID=401976 RepID=A0A4R1HNV2_PSEEN|nr:ABC transporter ATP-binding protein [Pseudonocardia endophytica]TCK22305.1 ABC-2 type transport system ATP-binding protein [Pseudonocardia endophytica]
MLDVKDLRKNYGPVTALDGFSLHVSAGEIVGLLGHNGAGKTTFLDIVANQIRPEAGSVTIDGRKPAKAGELLGIAPQHLALYPAMTVREHLRLFGGVAGLRRAALRSATEDVVTALQLTECLDRHVGTLSGGQQRRTQAAIALVHRPRLLLLDEPTAGADPETRQALLDVVKQQAGDGAAVVYTTHYLPELADLHASVAVVRNGRVISRGTSDELLAGLPSEVTVSFDGDEVRRTTTEPAQMLVELLRDTDRPLSGVDIRDPSLDDLYRSLVGSDVR